MSSLHSMFAVLDEAFWSCSTTKKPHYINVSKPISYVDPVFIKKRSQDWSRAISAFRQNVIQLNAIIALEKQIQECTVSMNKYLDHLSHHLPQSAILLQEHTQWRQKERECQTECNEAIQRLNNLYKKYDKDPRVQIPQTLTNQMKEIQKEYMKLLKQANEITDQIPERIRNWEIFRYRLDKFSTWLNKTQEELKKITRFYLFLTDFKHVLERHKVIEIESTEKLKDFQYLQHNHEKHLLSLGVKADPESLKYRTTFSVAKEQWEEFRMKMHTFATDKKPWENMVDIYNDLDRWKDNITQEIKDVEERERELERSGKNNGILSERYKHLLNEVKSKDYHLEQLRLSLEGHLTQDLRQNHEVVKKFVECCEKLRNKCEKLKQKLEHRYEMSIQKMEEWEKRVLILEDKISKMADHIKVIEKAVEVRNQARFFPAIKGLTHYFIRYLPPFMYVIIASLLVFHD